MRNLSTVAIPAVIALAFACAESVAQDTPAAGAAKKPNTSVNSSSKAAKPAARTPVPSNSTGAKAPGERGGTSQVAPAAHRVAPTVERDDDSCHGKDSDA